MSKLWWTDLVKEVFGMEFTSRRCQACGIPVLVPQFYLDHVRMHENAKLYCPAGHEVYVGRDSPESMKDTISDLRGYLKERDRQNAALKGQITKLKARISSKRG